MSCNLDEALYLGSGAFGDVYAIDAESAVKHIIVGRNEHKKRLIIEEIKLMLDLKL